MKPAYLLTLLLQPASLCLVATVSIAQTIQTQAVPTGRVPHLALKLDLLRPLGVNLHDSGSLFSTVPYKFHWPVFVALEAGLGRRFSVELAGHYCGGVAR